MHRCAVAAVAALGLAVPASAVAILLGKYHGNVKGDPASTISFDIERVNGHRKVTRFISEGIAFSCSVGTPGDTPHMRIKGRFRIEDRAFRGRGEAVEIDADPFGIVTGRLKDGGRAAGTLKLRGELDGNPGSKCSTGVVEWRAEKGTP
jgi:hypothetical protein